MLTIWLKLHSRGERGATAVEYAMLLVLAGIIFGMAYGFTHVLHTVFQHQCDKIAAPTGTCR